MATSTSDLIDEVVSGLKGFTGDQEPATTLMASVSPTDLVLQYDPDLPPTAGLVEIDDELIQTTKLNATSATLTVPPWGRAQQQSTAAAHAGGAKVTVSPLWPRSRVFTVLNEVVRSLDTNLYQIKTAEFTFSPSVSTYSLPADCVEILDVSQQVIGPSQAWVPVRHYRMDGAADTGSFANGRSITLGQALYPGRTVKVAYAGALSPLTTGGVLTDTGLAESCRDLLVAGAQYRFCMTADFARLVNTTVEQAQSGDTPVTSASSIASRLKQMFDLRVTDEKLRLQRLVQTRVTYSR